MDITNVNAIAHFMPGVTLSNIIFVQDVSQQTNCSREDQLSYVQTDATTPNNVGSCWHTILCPFAKSLTSFKLCTTTPNNMQQGVQMDETCNIQQCLEFFCQQCCVRSLRLHANRHNIVDQQLPTLLDVTCCVRLHTLLHVVGCCCAKFETSQTFQPTTPNSSFIS